MKTIYLDNAATTSMLPSVIDTMLPYMAIHFGNPSSIHTLGRDARVAIEKSRKKIANIIGSPSAHIFFTSSATESMNTAILGSILSWGIKHFITSAIEHSAVLNTLLFYQKIFHLEIQYLPLLDSGNIDIQALEKSLSNKNDNSPTAVILMHVNNELGNTTDILQVGNICRKYNAKFISDMVQSLGIYDVSLDMLPVDIAIMSAHKIHGPKGAGLLYVNTKKFLTPLIHGGSQERNMRAGTENVAAIVGFAQAVEYAYKNIPQKIKHFMTLRDSLLQGLQQYFSNLILNTDINQSSPKILNVGFPINAKTEMLLYHLDIEHICVSGGSACSSGSNVVSHVIKYLPNKPQQIPLRFSFSENNTLEEINHTIEVMKKILS